MYARHNLSRLLLLIASMAILSSNLVAAKLSGTDVMQKVYDQAHIHHTQTSSVFMTIVDEKDRKRERYFNLWKKHYPEIKSGPNKAPSEDRSLIKFYRPSDVKGTALLTKSFGDDQEDMQWIYFPFTKMLKRLSSGDKHKSFMGSDFSYADIAGRSIDQDTHKLSQETDKYYVVESIPKDKEDAYSKIVNVVEKERMVPVKVVFYGKKKDKNGKALKVKTLYNKKTQAYKKMHVVTQSVMEKAKKGKSKKASYTILEFSDVKVGIEISDNVVGLQGVQRK